MVPAMPSAAATIRPPDESAPGASRICHTQAVLNELPLEVRTAIIAVLLIRSVPSSAIVATLAKHGVEVRTENLNRHRRRLTGVGAYACKCPLPEGARP